MPGADLDQRGGGIGRQRGGKGLGELAQRAVDDDAAVSRARGQVDGVELAQFENMLGIDRVGIAQPVFDLGDRQRCRPRGTRRPRRGLVDALDLGGMIERSRPGKICPALLACLLPALFAGNRRQPLDEARYHGRRTRELGRISEDDLVGAERLGEVVCRQRDAPLRQIEAERMAHGAAEPGVRPRLRRPDAFDQAAEDDAIDVLQPRFERAIDTNAHARNFRAPHHAIRNRDPEKLGIVCLRDEEAGGGVRTRNVVECLIEFHAVIAGEGRWLTAFVPAQGGDDVAMSCGKFGEGERRAG